MIEINGIHYVNVDNYLENNSEYPTLQSIGFKEGENLTLIISGIKIKIKEQNKNGTID